MVSPESLDSPAAWRCAIYDVAALSRHFIPSSCTSPESEVHSPDSRFGSLCPASTVSPSNDLAVLSQGFPFPPVKNGDGIYDVIWDQALMLTNVYFGQFSWIYHSVSCNQIDEMLPVIYRKLTAPSDDEDYTGPQDLACLFVVLAIGSLVDGDCDSLAHSMEYAICPFIHAHMMPS
ncbi:hypothetical protein ARMSODRAFT_963872 [Armillaria solidipes]|uniref:Transcription factor domain-containing protein n=1 Tax=Armillaria solidipes TaxID=1076256 RepID=A0A2H3BG30_9AGAR|nr:hypothetical protein ARMSODRAFT_963872 [Armillaria solidipes]